MADVGAENPSAETEATNGSAGSGRALHAAADGEEDGDEASVTQKANPESNGSSSSGSAAAAQEDLLLEVRNLMRRITAARPSPHPRFLHTLASILEEEEELFQKSVAHLPSSSSRSSHTIGRLSNLIRENDDFFELICSKVLVDSRHSIAVKAAAARLLLASLPCGMYPDAFDDAVLSNIKKWVTEDTPRLVNDMTRPSKLSSSKAMSAATTNDWEMLKSYSFGLMALALTTGGSIVEELLATGVAAKIMHYLRIRLLKEGSNQKDPVISQNRGSVSGSVKGRDDAKLRVRLSLETSRVDTSIDALECQESMQSRAVERDIESMYDADDDKEWVGEENVAETEKKEGKSKGIISNSTHITTEDIADEGFRGEPSKRKGDARDRGSGKLKGKGKSAGGVRIGSQHEKTKGLKDVHKTFRETEAVSFVKEAQSYQDDEEKGESDDKYVCIIADDLDISLPIQKAARAAKSEAKAAGASYEAIKAAGEAAADLVKAAALEALGESLDKDAALAAAVSAATSVEDAGAATKAVSNHVDGEDYDNEENEIDLPELGDCVPSSEKLATLREWYSVQCLERLGEYVEVLGPVLHERGVDVCLALLQRESESTTTNKPKSMLCDVLKLICALAAHRKFSSLFVDRGGVQLILAAPRNSQTYTGISLCLFAFASVQGVMERVCAAPAEVVDEVVTLALHILECAPDPARRNAALFFGASFVFKAILDAFDAHEGLRQLLNLLRNASVVRSGGDPSMPGSSTSSRGDRTASAEVLTSSEKQIAFHTCVALRQYFRAQLLILVDSIRPFKGRIGARTISSGRAGYKPLDISNEAIDNLLLQIQRDRKLGPAFVKSRWQALEKFMSYTGHLLLLELTQVAPGERYLHDIAPHALGVLQIVTLVPSARRAIVSCTLSNDRSGMAVLLDAASATAYAEPEGIQAALLVLVNLVCPPPSLSSRPNQASNISHTPQQQNLSLNSGKAENHLEKSGVDRAQTSVADTRERRDGTSEKGFNGSLQGNVSQPTGLLSPAATLVGDRRISLGSVAGGSGIAANMEQGYRQACDAVRANNGIKVLLHLLHPRTVLPPASLDCIRALACRVLLGLSKDDAIAHILTKLQVGKLLSELPRDAVGQVGRIPANGEGEQGRWQKELCQLSMELMAIVTNAGRAGTLVASDAAAPTFRRIERAAIAAATSISYPSRELLQLIHEHLVLSGLPNTAAALLKEAQIVPLPSLPSRVPFIGPVNVLELPQELRYWPSGRVPSGFLIEAPKQSVREDERTGSSVTARKKGPSFSSSLLSPTVQSPAIRTLRPAKESRDLASGRTEVTNEFCISGTRLGESEYNDQTKLPSKRKFSDRVTLQPPGKRLAAINEREGISAACISPRSSAKNMQLPDDNLLLTSPPTQLLRDSSSRLDKSEAHGHGSSVYKFQSPLPPLPSTQQASNLETHTCQPERATLDSLVIQYLKHQHRQCPAPITTLPPISLFQPHICPEPSRACYAPYNLTTRIGARRMFPPCGGMHGRRRDRHYIFSRFRYLRPCRDERVLLTSTTFLGTTFRLAASSLAGEIQIFDCHSGDVLETHICHQSPITLLESSSQEIFTSVEFSGDSSGHLLLSSGSFDVRLWNSSTLGEVPLYSFDNCRAARFNTNGNMFAAISSVSPREVLLYNVESGKLEQKLSDISSSSGVLRGSAQCIPHFSPSDMLLLWNGVLWDHRLPRAVHRFEQFTDYGGGGFHPSGNEVIINSEVWDLRSYKLLRSVPSLDQTVITFNATGDVIYATLRRNLEDITSARNHRRSRHPLYSAFRTMDALDYSDIATTLVDRCVLDLATEPTDSLISIVGLDGHDDMDSSAKLYEVGRRKPTDDDSDPDDGVESDDDEDSLGEEETLEEDALHGRGDESDLDGSNGDRSADEDAEEDVDADFDTNEEDDDELIELDGSMVELMTDGSDDETWMSYSSGDDGSFGDYEEDGFNDILQGFL